MGRDKLGIDEAKVKDYLHWDEGEDVMAPKEFIVPTYTNSNLPSSAQNGSMAYDSTNKCIAVRLNGSWVCTDGYGFSSEADTLFDAMDEEPTAARKVIINTYIQGLIDAGIWAKLDVLVIFAAHDAQASLLDWKRYIDPTAVNSPSFEVDRGYTGDGSSMYLNSNFTPTADGVQYGQYDASFGCYIRTDVQDGGIDMGVDDGVTSRRMYLKSHPSAFVSEVVLNSISIHQWSNSNSAAMYGIVDIVSTHTDSYKNGVKVNHNSTTDGSLNTRDVYILGRNVSGTASNFNSKQLAMYFFGKGDIDQAAFFTLTEAYMDAIGAGVVS